MFYYSVIQRSPGRASADGCQLLTSAFALMPHYVFNKDTVVDTPSVALGRSLASCAATSGHPGTDRTWTEPGSQPVPLIFPQYTDDQTRPFHCCSD